MDLVWICRERSLLPFLLCVLSCWNVECMWLAELVEAWTWCVCETPRDWSLMPILDRCSLLRHSPGLHFNFPWRTYNLFFGVSYQSLFTAWTKRYYVFCLFSKCDVFSLRCHTLCACCPPLSMAPLSARLSPDEQCIDTGWEEGL